MKFFPDCRVYQCSRIITVFLSDIAFETGFVSPFFPTLFSLFGAFHVGGGMARWANQFDV